MKNKKQLDSYLENFFYSEAWDIMDEVFPDPPHGHVEDLGGSQRLIKLANLGKKTDVLDIGSGYAGLGIYLVKMFNCKVTSVELSGQINEKAIKIAKTEGAYPSMKFITGDINNVELGKIQFDYIFSTDALVQINNRYNLFRKSFEALKEKGKFAFSDYILHVPNEERDIKEYFESIGSPGMETLESYIKILTDAGFNIIYKRRFKQEAERWIGNLVNRLNKSSNYFIDKYGKEEFEAINNAFSVWLKFAKNNIFSYCRIVAEKFHEKGE